MAGGQGVHVQHGQAQYGQVGPPALGSTRLRGGMTAADGSMMWPGGTAAYPRGWHCQTARPRMLPWPPAASPPCRPQLRQPPDLRAASRCLPGPQLQGQQLWSWRGWGPSQPWAAACTPSAAPSQTRFPLAGDACAWSCLQARHTMMGGEADVMQVRPIPRLSRP